MEEKVMGEQNEYFGWEKEGGRGWSPYLKFRGIFQLVFVISKRVKR